jgi:hypothetical protein
MTVTDIQNALLKHKRPLALFVAIVVLLCHFYLEIAQTHTATVYIKYVGENAENGQAANGSALKPYEITDSYVVGEALKKLGINDIKASSLAQKITVTPMLSMAEQDKYASWIDQFSSYEETEDNKLNPVYYCIQFESEDGIQFARDFLGTLVQQYRVHYAQKYVGQRMVVAETESAILKADYFIAAQRLQDRLEANVDYLATIVDGDTNYRSPSTGYSISDLIDAHDYLLETSLAPVNRYILDIGISKDADTLIASLRNSIDNSQLDSEKHAQKAETQEQLMELYAEKNYDYMWEVIAGDEDNSQVRHDAERDKRYNAVKTTYDQMVLDYVGYATTSRNLLIDKAYNEYYLSQFTTLSATNETLDAEMDGIYREYQQLHDLTIRTLEGYNDYLAARQLMQVSGVQVEETLPDLLYYAVSGILSVGLGVVCVLFLELKREKKI